MSVSIPAERERQRAAQMIQRVDHQACFAHQERDALRPPAGDVGQHQRPDETAGQRPAAVRDEICLDETRSRVLPIAERTYRHAAPQPVQRGAPALTGRHGPRGRQAAVDRRGTHRQAKGIEYVEESQRGILAMSTSREVPVSGYVPPRSLGEADIQRMVENGVPEREAREVVSYDYVAWDERTYGDEIMPVTIDLLDIGRVPAWAKGSEPSIEHAVEVALLKDPPPFDRYVSAAWPGPAAGPVEQWGGAQAAAERALVPEKWEEPSLLSLEERRVAVFDPATGSAAWFQLIFADTEGPWDDEAIHAGSAEAQWHLFEYEAESDTPWDNEDDEARMVTCRDSWTVMRLKSWRPNCLIAEPPFDDGLNQDGLRELLDHGVLFRRLGLLVAAFRRWCDFTDPQRSAEPESGWFELLGDLEK